MSKVTSVALATESSGYVVKNPCDPSLFPPPPQFPSPSLPLLIFVMYFMRQPSSLLYNHQIFILRFFSQTDRQTDRRTDLPTYRLTDQPIKVGKEVSSQSLKSCWCKGI